MKKDKYPTLDSRQKYLRFKYKRNTAICALICSVLLISIASMLLYLSNKYNAIELRRVITVNSTEFIVSMICYGLGGLVLIYGTYLLIYSFLLWGKIKMENKKVKL